MKPRGKFTGDVMCCLGRIEAEGVVVRAGLGKEGTFRRRCKRNGQGNRNVGNSRRTVEETPVGERQFF